MNPRRLTASLIIGLVSLLTAQACGPDFFPDVFIRKLRPDNPKDFAAGKLGILLPTYPRQDLIVAYRYLNGNTLDVEEQKAYEPYKSIAEITAQDSESADSQPLPDNEDPAQPWATLRAKYPSPAPKIDPNAAIHHDISGGFTYDTPYPNCNADAFKTAALILTSRAKTWGAKSPDFRDWLHAQDAVFANCEKPVNLPSPAPANSSPLLQQDRAYQTAAALFYQGKFPEARAAFETIATDPTSPWHGIAPYLAARSLIRQAFLKADHDETADLNQIDAAQMQQAQTILESQLNQPHPGISDGAIESMLDLVRIRTEQSKQVRHLSAVLTGPAHDPRYAQHLTDLTWYLDNHLTNMAIREDNYLDDAPLQEHCHEGEISPECVQARAKTYTASFLGSSNVRAMSPVADWVVTLQSPAPEARDHAIAEWRKHSDPIWLTAAIIKAEPQDSATPDLIAAAAKLAPNEPAWETATYHRIRLLLATGKTDQARNLLAETIPQIQAANSGSALNAYTGLRMHAALNLTELLTYAPRRILLRSSESNAALLECLDVMKNPKRVYDCREDKSPVQFSEDATTFFNTQSPLSLLVESAQSDALPEPLRRSLAIMAWTRSILLDDNAAAQKLYPLLPAKLQTQSAPGTGFPALVTIARNAGLRPFLDPGIQRIASYDFVESYRDNWWCSGKRGSIYADVTSTEPNLTQSAPFLTPDQRTQAAKEVDALNRLTEAKLSLGTQIYDYAQSHPDDPAAPESLFHILRMIRYGCETYTYPETPASKAKDAQIAKLHKDAARLLRQRYAASPWTRKAAPFVG